MTVERPGAIRFGDRPMTLIGADLPLDRQAPNFAAMDGEWQLRRPLEETEGQVRVLLSLPSLETEVCDRETRRFSQEATGLGENVRVFAISMDLPFTQQRWCAGAGVERVKTLSDHFLAEFGTLYGCLIKEVRLLRRAVFVVDPTSRLVYVEYVPTLGEEPRYEDVLKAVRQALPA